jgi:hypothetical protein
MPEGAAILAQNRLEVKEISTKSSIAKALFVMYNIH